MTFEEQIQWIDGVISDLKTAHDAYRSAVTKLRGAAQGERELVDMITGDNCEHLLRCAIMLEASLLAAVAARELALKPQTLHAPPVHA